MEKKLALSALVFFFFFFLLQAWEGTSLTRVNKCRGYCRESRDTFTICLDNPKVNVSEAYMAVQVLRVLENLPSEIQSPTEAPSKAPKEPQLAKEPQLSDNAICRKQCEQLGEENIKLKRALFCYERHYYEDRSLSGAPAENEIRKRCEPFEDVSFNEWNMCVGLLLLESSPLASRSIHKVPPPSPGGPSQASAPAPVPSSWI